MITDPLLATVEASIQKTKKASQALARIDSSKRQEVLASLANALRCQTTNILKENAKDLLAFDSNDSMYDRLLLTEKRLRDMAEAIDNVAMLPSSLGNIIEHKTMANGLNINKISAPLGVVAVIYESRPNVTTDIFSLCFKTANACLLKGGKEAHHSNSILVKIIQNCLRSHGIDEAVVYLLPADRQATLLLLGSRELVDVCIPRGSQALIDFVRNNAKIPIIETGAGIVHLYFDQSADLRKGQAIIHNAKTRRVSVCNALDCLLVHSSRLTQLPFLVEKLQQQHVEIFADERAYQHLENVYPSSLLHHASLDDFGREFLSYKIAIKTVSSYNEAISHINHYTSHHSEAIVSENKEIVQLFMQEVDAAVVYVNASTAFTDGGEFGMGSEIGISTQKLHARGPMGLDALTTYKWLVYGDGHTR